MLDPPYMLLSYRTPFVFIHVPKTGGTSVRRALAPFAFLPRRLPWNRLLAKLGVRSTFPHNWYREVHDHMPARDVRSLLPAETFERSFKFAFVRNSWDLVASSYRYARKMSHRPEYAYATRLSCFDEYVERLAAGKATSQWSLLSDEWGKPLVDFVGRYEQIDVGFKHVCRRLEIDARLPHLNATAGVTAGQARDGCYTQRSKILVARLYAEDIEEFGFRFDESPQRRLRLDRARLSA